MYVLIENSEVMAWSDTPIIGYEKHEHFVPNLYNGHIFLENGVFVSYPHMVDGKVFDKSSKTYKSIVVPYNEKRREQYPPMEEQLDMLFHAMDKGEIPKATEWYNTIKKVKDKYPKGVQ